MTNDWSECSAEGCGEEGVETQGYTCQLYFMNNDTYLDADMQLCDPNNAPKSTRNCTSPPCNLAWTIGDWSEVSCSVFFRSSCSCFPYPPPLPTPLALQLDLDHRRLVGGQLLSFFRSSCSWLPTPTFPYPPLALQLDLDHRRLVRGQLLSFSGLRVHVSTAPPPPNTHTPPRHAVMQSGLDHRRLVRGQLLIFQVFVFKFPCTP